MARFAKNEALRAWRQLEKNGFDYTDDPGRGLRLLRSIGKSFRRCGIDVHNDKAVAAAGINPVTLATLTNKLTWITRRRCRDAFSAALSPATTHEEKEAAFCRLERFYRDLGFKKENPAYAHFAGEVLGIYDDEYKSFAAKFAPKH